jgi:Arc/MetJ family transcription regulator
MKRTNLVLDEELLKEATREMGLKTYSATVNAVLKEAVRRMRVRKIADFVGKVEWIGDLSEMREDSPRKRPIPTGRKKKRA